MKSRKANLAKLIGLLVVIAVVTTAVLTGTMSKYVKTMSAKDYTARVAKFNPENQFESFDLFSSSYNSGKVQAKNPNGTNSTDKIVAPGTSGYIAFTTDPGATSEVTVAISLTWTLINSGSIPLTFTLKSGSDIGSASVVVASSANLDNIQAYSGYTSGTNYYLVWEWPFSTGADASDTALGTATNPATVKVTVQATFTQVQ